MDSVKTTSTSFVKIDGYYCITQVMAVAVGAGWFQLYVAWEFEDMAKKGVFGFAKSRKLYQEFNWAYRR